MRKGTEKGLIYLAIAAAIAALIFWLYSKHEQIAKRIGLGGQIETSAPGIQTTLTPPEETAYIGAPL